MTADFPAVMPHGALQPIDEHCWFLTGSVNFKPLVRLARNMVVLRQGDELAVINAVRLDAEGEAALDALGKVAHVLKIGFHGMDDAYYVDRYGAKQWTVADLREGVPFADLTPFFFEETVNPEAALLWGEGGGLLITCDSVQHWAPSDLMSPIAKLITGAFGFKHPAQIGPPWRKVMTPPGGTLKPDFDRLVGLSFQRLIGAHGGLLEADAPAVLQASIDRNFGTA